MIHQRLFSQTSIIQPEVDVSTLKSPRHQDILGYGVFQEKENADINFLVENFTAPALARALRVREQVN